MVFIKFIYYIAIHMTCDIINYQKRLWHFFARLENYILVLRTHLISFSLMFLHQRAYHFSCVFLCIYLFIFYFFHCVVNNYLGCVHCRLRTPIIYSKRDFDKSNNFGTNIRSSMSFFLFFFLVLIYIWQFRLMHLRDIFFFHDHVSLSKSIIYHYVKCNVRCFFLFKCIWNGLSFFCCETLCYASQMVLICVS